jgi:hypothetical protein
MEECPHCEEPLDEGAVSCPHCGSDSETGWNPDSEYYSVELPEEDLLESKDCGATSASTGWEKAASASLVLMACVLFLTVGTGQYQRLLLPFLGGLLLCMFLYYQWLSPKRKT